MWGERSASTPPPPRGCAPSVALSYSTSYRGYTPACARPRRRGFALSPLSPSRCWLAPLSAHSSWTHYRLSGYVGLPPVGTHRVASLCHLGLQAFGTEAWPTVAALSTCGCIPWIRAVASHGHVRLQPLARAVAGQRDLLPATRSSLQTARPARDGRPALSRLRPRLRYSRPVGTDGVPRAGRRGRGALRGPHAGRRVRLVGCGAGQGTGVALPARYACTATRVPTCVPACCLLPV